MSDSLRKGALLLLLGEALLAIMGAMIKHLSDSLSTEQIVFFRNFAGLLVLLPILWRAGGGLSQFKTQVLKWHVMRSLVGLTAMYCYFFVLGRMPLAEAFLVKLTSPFFMPFIAWWWLKEPTGGRALYSIAIGFIGVLFILKPNAQEGLQMAALVGLLGAVLAALAKVTIRKMAATENKNTVVFYFAAIASCVSAPMAILNWQSIPAHAWLWLALVGVVATLGQLALTRAYQLAPTGKIGVYVYSAVVYGALMGWWFWQEALSLSTIIGAALIIAAGTLNLKDSSRHAHNNSKNRLA